MVVSNLAERSLVSSLQMTPGHKKRVSRKLQKIRCKLFQITFHIHTCWFVVINMIPVFVILGKLLSEMYFVVIHDNGVW